MGSVCPGGRGSTQQDSALGEEDGANNAYSYDTEIFGPEEPKGTVKVLVSTLMCA